MKLAHLLAAAMIATALLHGAAAETPEYKAAVTAVPNLDLRGMSPAKALEIISKASGIKVFYTPPSAAVPNLTLNLPATSPASAIYHVAAAARLKMTWKEDGAHLEDLPPPAYWLTPDTVEYQAETTVIAQVDWKGVTTAEALKAVTTATGIKTFYTPRKGDPANVVIALRNLPASVAIQDIADVSGLSFTYKKDGVYLAPDDHKEQDRRAGERWRPELAAPSDLNPRSLTPQVLQGQAEGYGEMLVRRSVVKVGDQAPDISCRLSSGEELSIKREKGKVIMINFMTTRGDSTARELAHFEKNVLQKYGDRKDFRMLTFGYGQEAPVLEEFARVHHLALPFAPDPQKTIFNQFATDLIRRTYIIGKDGKIRLISGGTIAPVLREGKTRMEVVGYTEAAFQEINATLREALAAP